MRKVKSMQLVTSTEHKVLEITEESFKVSELRQMCKDMGVSQNGNKKALCQRLNKVYSKYPDKGTRDILKFWHNVFINLPVPGTTFEDCETIKSIGNDIHPDIKLVKINNTSYCNGDGNGGININITGKNYTNKQMFDLVTTGYVMKMVEMGETDYEWYLAVEKVEFDGINGILSLEVTT